MKNFLRALRHAWPYRGRFALSVFCAALAAMLWGLNFTSIYPVLKLLNDPNKETPHEWVDGCIKGVQSEIAVLEPQSKPLQAQLKKLETLPSSQLAEHQKRDATSELARVERKLAAARALLCAMKSPVNIFMNMPRPTAFKHWLGLSAFSSLLWPSNASLNSVREALVGSVVNLTLFDMRNRFYRNVIHLDVDQFGDQGSSELTARFTNDMETLGAGVKMLLGKVISEPLRALACVVGACFISWQLTLLFLILVPIAIVVLTKVGRIMKRATRRLLERMSSIYKILQESFQGIRVVKAFTMEPAERRRFQAATRDYYRKSMMVVKIDALADPIIELLGVMAIAGALLAGSYLVMYDETHLFGISWLRISDQPLDAEALLSLYIFLGAIADPVRKLSSVFTRIQSGCAAADRIFTYIDKRPRVLRQQRRAAPQAADPGRSRRLGRDDARSSSSATSVFPTTQSSPYSTTFTSHVRAGETIALVGPNGCGKSTLLSLLPRFYDPNYGTILIEGHDLRGVHMRSLRKQIGVVTQEVILFDDTIFNNIAYGKRNATQEQVETCSPSSVRP